MFTVEGNSAHTLHDLPYPHCLLYCIKDNYFRHIKWLKFANGCKLYAAELSNMCIIPRDTGMKLEWNKDLTVCYSGGTENEAPVSSYTIICNEMH